MIRSSALLIAAAMAVLAAGVFASSLELVYVSIGVSILAAVMLSIGVVLRRGEIFGGAGTGQQDVPAVRPAAEVTAVPVMADGRAGPGRDDRQAADRPHDAGREAAARPDTDTDQAPPRWERPAPGPGRYQPAASWAQQDATAPEPDRAGPPEPDRAGPPAGWPGGFRVPPFGDGRPAGTRPGEEPVPLPGPAAGPSAGEEFWDRVSGELADSGTQDPARPAWPSTAGPRAMGAGTAAQQALAGAGGGEPDIGHRPGDLFTPRRARAQADAPGTGGGDSGGSGVQDSAAQAAAQDAAAAQVSPARGGSTADRDGAGDAGTGDAHPGDAAAAGDAGEPEDAGQAGEPGSRDTGTAAAPDGEKDSAAAGQASATGTGEAAPAPKQPAAGDQDGEPQEKPGMPAAGKPDGSGAMPRDGDVTIVPGVSRYHRRGCILIRFLSDGDLETMTRGRAEAAGCVPCKACQPDKPVSG